MIPAVVLNLTKVVSTGNLSRLTGIRPWRLQSFAKGIITPRAVTVKKLLKAYRSINYVNMRGKFFNISTARRFAGAAPKTLTSTIDKWNGIAERIAVRNKKSITGVLEGISRSDLSLEELEARSQWS